VAGSRLINFATSTHRRKVFMAGRIACAHFWAYQHAPFVLQTFMRHPKTPTSQFPSCCSAIRP